MKRLNVLLLCNQTINAALPWLEAGHNVTTIDLQLNDDLEPGQPAVTLWESGATYRELCLDVRDLVDRNGNAIPLYFEKYDIVIAFPPCKNLAVSGAKHFKVKGLSALIASLEIVNACRLICEQSGAPWMLENPKSTLGTYWRECDYRFHPWQYNGIDFNDTYVKGTCLWTGGGFIMPEFETHPDTIRVMAQVKEMRANGELSNSKGKPLSGKPLLDAIRKHPDVDHEFYPDDRIHQAGPTTGGDRANFRAATPLGFSRALFKANIDQLTNQLIGV